MIFECKCVFYFSFCPLFLPSDKSSCQTVSQCAANRALPETLMLWLCYRITVAVGQQPRVALHNHEGAKEMAAGRDFLQSRGGVCCRGWQDNTRLRFL